MRHKRVPARTSALRHEEDLTNMNSRTLQGRVLLFVTMVLLAIVSVFAAQSLVARGQGGATRATLTAKEEEADFVNAYCKTNVKTAIPSGSEAEARKYYQDLAGRIGFQVQDLTPDQPG